MFLLVGITFGLFRRFCLPSFPFLVLEGTSLLVFLIDQIDIHPFLALAVMIFDSRFSGTHVCSQVVACAVSNGFLLVSLCLLVVVFSRRNSHPERCVFKSLLGFLLLASFF